MEWKRQELIYWLLIFTVVALVGLAIVVIRYDVPNKDVGLETFKALLQFVIVGLLGASIAAILKDIELDRQQREAIREFKKLIVVQLVDAYSQTKQIRRLLRAKGLTPTTVRQKVYSQEMERLSSIQLNLEAVGTKIDTSQEVFRNAADLTTRIRRMDTYLSDHLVDEYEVSFGKFDPQLKECPLADLPKLNDFLTFNYDNSRFRTEFVEPYRQVLHDIQREILEVR